MIDKYWRDKIRHYRLYLIILGFLLSALVLIFLTSSNLYPIATVNGVPIGASRFQQNYRAAKIYSENLRRTYMATSTIPQMPDSEIETQILNQLIEAEIIGQAVKTEVGKDLDYLVGNKLERYDEDSSLGRATPTLYGMSYRDFRREVLVPQAERDILAGRLFLRGDNFEELLNNLKHSAKVAIFSRKFIWADGTVVKK